MDNDSNLGNQVDALLKECHQLRDEIGRLRRILIDNDIDPAPPPAAPAFDARPHPRIELSTDQKVALFRALFRGREDVYAVRWESPDGRHGYSPKSERDWKAYNASKPEDRKRIDKETRKYIPLTGQAIHDHLAGKHTIGIYPLLRDETCWFLAVDFDKKTWEADVAAFLDTCKILRVPAALERSRSGNGGHVWVFFDRPIPAVVARKLGVLLLTRTMERRHEIGLDSYDRFFPNQDTMPKGGFGNLIALPLQKVPRVQHHTEFLDERLSSYSDQWAFLSSVQRMSQFAAEQLILDAQRDGDLIGVRISIADDEDQPDPWIVPADQLKAPDTETSPVPCSVPLVIVNAAGASVLPVF